MVSMASGEAKRGSGVLTGWGRNAYSHTLTQTTDTQKYKCCKCKCCNGCPALEGTELVFGKELEKGSENGCYVCRNWCHVPLYTYLQGWRWN